MTEMNEASNKIAIPLTQNSAIQFQVVHFSDPPVTPQNPSGVTEDYYVISHAGNPQLIRVCARSPLRIEPVDLTTSKGDELWKQVRSLLSDESTVSSPKQDS